MSTPQTLNDALKILQSDKNLTVCNVTGVELRDAGVSDLVFALRKTKVQQLILSNCKIGIQGIVHLTTFLKYNKTLQRLYLQHNPDIGDKGIEELAKVIQQNKNLSVLNIAACNVGDVGAAAIAEILQENKCSLQKLYLYNNKIGSLGASALAEMIPTNSILMELFLWDNPLTDEGLDILKDAYDAAGKGKENERRMLLMTGLKNSQVSKKKAPEVKRNYKLPQDEKENNVNTTKISHGELMNFWGAQNSHE
jgi:hypothetical protein